MSEKDLASKKVSGWASSVEPGQQFGMLVAISEFHLERVPWWKCRCDCGQEWNVRRGGLVSGRSTSCGCRRRRDPARPSGPSVRLWRIWHGMLHRCREGGEDWNQRGYAMRGIVVCEEWHTYGAFFGWAIANGYADGLTIDRRDNDGDYEPGNCRWATNKVQTRNTRRTVWVEHAGARVSLAEAVEDLGLDYHAVYNRHVRAGRLFADVVDELIGGPPQSRVEHNEMPARTKTGFILQPKSTNFHFFFSIAACNRLTRMAIMSRIAIAASSSVSGIPPTRACDGSSGFPSPCNGS